MSMACGFAYGGHFTELANWGMERRVTGDVQCNVSGNRRGKKRVSRDEKLLRLQTLFVCKHTLRCYSV